MPEEQPRTKWETFAGWHSEPSLYREIYTRTVSALTAALVIYLVAAVSGIVSRRPLIVLLVLSVTVLAGNTAVELVRRWRRHRKGGSDETVLIRSSLVTRWIAGISFVLFAAAVVAHELW